MDVLSRLVSLKRLYSLHSIVVEIADLAEKEIIQLRKQLRDLDKRISALQQELDDRSKV